jgi:hypothetical protein
MRSARVWRKIGQGEAAKFSRAHAGAESAGVAQIDMVNQGAPRPARASVRLTVGALRTARALTGIRRVALLRLLMTAARRLAVATVLVLALIGLALPRILALRLMLLSVAMALAMHLLRMLLLMVLLLLLLLALMLAVCADHAIVVLRVLIEILGGDPVASGARVARHRQIFLQHLIRVAADADIRPAAVEGLRALGHMRFTAVVTATLTLHVWTGSHDT